MARLSFLSNYIYLCPPTLAFNDLKARCRNTAQLFPVGFNAPAKVVSDFKK